jgi:phosphoribosylglycinamide formyltransferase-1
MPNPSFILSEQTRSSESSGLSHRRDLSGNRRRIVALASGRGSNLAALIQSPPAALGGQVVGVVSNVAGAPALALAAAAKIDTIVVDHRTHTSREHFDAALLEATLSLSPDLVVLAGFMRILTPVFIAPLGGRLLNIHPSLLPALPGLHTHERAIADGHGEHGATVHFVSAEVDAGPPIVRGRVPVLDGDTPDALAARVLAVEHRIYPLAVALCCSGRVRLVDGAALFDDVALDSPIDLERWEATT